MKRILIKIIICILGILWVLCSAVGAGRCGAEDVSVVIMDTCQEKCLRVDKKENGDYAYTDQQCYSDCLKKFGINDITPKYDKSWDDPQEAPAYIDPSLIKKWDCYWVVKKFNEGDEIPKEYIPFFVSTYPISQKSEFLIHMIWAKRKVCK